MKCERRGKITETSIEAAKAGEFVILSDSSEKLAPFRHVDTIFYLDSLDEFIPWLRDNGAEILGDSPPVIKLISGGRQAVFRDRTWFGW